METDRSSENSAPVLEEKADGASSPAPAPREKTEKEKVLDRLIAASEVSTESSIWRRFDAD